MSRAALRGKEVKNATGCPGMWGGRMEFFFLVFIGVQFNLVTEG